MAGAHRLPRPLTASGTAESGAGAHAPPFHVHNPQIREPSSAQDRGGDVTPHPGVEVEESTLETVSEG